MKTYKHKKTGEIATYKDGILKSSGFSVEIGVEPSSEFWELVPQKEFEIMSFITNQDIYFQGDLSIKEDTIVNRTNNDDFYGGGVLGTEDELLANPKWSIHSIKRLSDGEVFTIGDRIQNPGYPYYILGNINVMGNEIELTQKDWNPSTDGVGTIRQFKLLIKLKPVFTTQDGVDIYLGDEYFAVDNGNTRGGVYKFNADGKFLEPSLVRFSTRELAEDYILLNKKCLSVQDIRKFLTPSPFNDKLTRELKDIAKSR